MWLVRGFCHMPYEVTSSRIVWKIIYRAQCKDWSSNYTGQSSRKLATRLKEHRSTIRNCNIKASLMAAHCVDTGHDLNLAETKILSHANSCTARLFKEARLSNENSTNKCIEWPQIFSVLRAAISEQKSAAPFFKKL